MKPLWILQNNGIDRITARIALELRKQGRAFVDVSVHDRESFEEVVLSRIAEEGFEVDVQPLFFYGSVLLLNGLAQSTRLRSSLRYTASNYEAPVWVEKLGQKMLNEQVSVCSLQNVFEIAESVFIRPYSETKLFTGEVVIADTFDAWFSKAKEKRSDLSLDSQVCASPIRDIQKEWRIFCEEGAPKLWSQYKSEGVLRVEQSLPSDAVEFAMQAARIWTPDRLCTLDLALTDQGYKIIEFNGIHCCGIYGVGTQAFIDFVDNALIR